MGLRSSNADTSYINKTQCICDLPIAEPLGMGIIGCAKCGHRLSPGRAATLSGRCRHCAFK